MTAPGARKTTVADTTDRAEFIGYRAIIFYFTLIDGRSTTTTIPINPGDNPRSYSEYVAAALVGLFEEGMTPTNEWTFAAIA